MTIKPILLASTGRSGSSLVMKILSLHPQIIIRSLFPYETRSFQYYFSASQQTEKQMNFSYLKYLGVEYAPCQQDDEESLDWQHQHKSHLVADDHCSIAFDYYKFVTKLESKESPVFFAEKAIGLDLTEQIIKSFPESRIIFLKRDPRDTFFSVKSFNQKRGFVSFGEEAGDVTMLQNLVDFCIHAQKIISNLDGRGTEIQYETLINYPQDTIKNLLQYLQLDCNPTLVEEISNKAFIDDRTTIDHKTQHNAQDSINRWKQEINDSYQTIFKQFHKQLELIGYHN
jgi:hypothetical protein